MRAIVSVLVATYFIASCVSQAPPPPPPPPPPPKSDPRPAVEPPPRAMPGHPGPRPPPKDGGGGGGGVEASHVVVEVLFATDRNRMTPAEPAAMFGARRAALTYGSCEVSIPRDHRMGELEAPSIWRLELSEDPDKHVVLKTVTVQDRQKFLDGFAIRMNQKAQRTAFVFVHGYNVSFADAARRTAQISYDLGFPGVPLFYSWPSQATTALYMEDTQAIEWTEPNLRSFLADVLGRSGDAEIVLIAHSMGNRALTRAVGTLARENPALRARIKEIILAAPDIDADVFRRDLAPAMLALRKPITLYASSNDLALITSKKLHGGYVRAGESGADLLVLPGIETIDASGVETDLLGHSYYGDSRSVLSDMFYLLREGKRAGQRFGLKPVDGAKGRYWTITK